MKKLTVLLVLAMLLGTSAVSFAASISPEIEGIYWSRGSAFAIGGGALIKLSPLGGLRARAGYTATAGKGYIVLIDGVMTYPINPKAELVVGGGMNYCDSNVTGNNAAIGGQFYVGINAKVSEKIGIFVDAGWINIGTKTTVGTITATTRTNDFTMAF